MNIKVFILILSGIIGEVSFMSINKRTLNEKKSQQIDFSGKWKWEKNDRYSTFSLTLEQVGNSINGYHCAISQNGNKIDCWGIDDNEYSIIGKIRNDLATITIKSYFSNNIEKDTGIATIRFINPNKIEWKITKDTEGQNYFPKKAILVRGSPSSKIPSKEEESVSQKKFPFLELGPLKKFQTAEEAYNAGYNDCKQGNAYGTSLRNKQYEMDYDYGWGKAGCPVR